MCCPVGSACISSPIPRRDCGLHARGSSKRRPRSRSPLPVRSSVWGATDLSNLTLNCQAPRAVQFFMRLCVRQRRACRRPNFGISRRCSVPVQDGPGPGSGDGAQAWAPAWASAAPPGRVQVPGPARSGVVAGSGANGSMRERRHAWAPRHGLGPPAAPRRKSLARQKGACFMEVTVSSRRPGSL